MDENNHKNSHVVGTEKKNYIDENQRNSLNEKS